VNFPLRVILALVVIAAIAAIGVWGLVAVLRVESMTRLQRLMAVGGILLVMLAPAAWVIFLWPAYWDWVALTSPSARADPRCRESSAGHGGAEP
jgi:hypothetical protein